MPHLRALDPKGFGEYFACGCVLQNRTLFPGISLLPAGSAWTFRPGQPPRKELFFDAQSWRNQSALPESEYNAKLKETIARVIPRYLRSQQNIAVSLTGGLDSRMIMAWAGCPPRSLPCYSHRGMIRECADARIARRVAAVCQQSHRLITVDGDFMGQFLPLAERTVYLSDGCMDVTGATGLYVNRIARDEIAPLRLTGNYGGEVLRGTVMLGPAKLRNPFFTPDLAARIQEGATTLNAERQCDRTSFIISKQVPWHHYARFCLESSQLTIRSPYLDNELVALAFQAPPEPAVNQRLAARLIADGNPALARFPTDRGPLGRDGLLGRLAERYQEFTFKADYAYDYGMPHWLVRADDRFRFLHLERLFLGRHKYYHFRHWYATHLAPCLKEVLLDPRSLARPWLDGRRVEQMVQDHTAGRGNYTLEIHLLLTTELMQRQLIERP
jgi:asparagine synthase (glutamine-hydrolysing)